MARFVSTFIVSTVSYWAGVFVGRRSVARQVKAVLDEYRAGLRGR